MSRYRDAAVELRPNASQWGAYQDSGNCVVLAGPGSGKTKLLTVKIARILAEDVRAPRAVACVTYSTECVRELRRRMNKLGVDESQSLFIGTLHAFCLEHVLLPYARFAGFDLPRPLNVAGIKVQNEVFEEARVSLNIGASPSLKKDLDKFRRDNLDIEKLDRDDIFTKLLLAYEQALVRRGLVDFDIMAREAVQIVERKPWARDCLRARFPVFVVDEYQDLGSALHRLVLALCCNARVRLVAVGDPDQSIYGFIGAHPEHLRALTKCVDVKTYRLALNYRSGTRIVAAARAVLSAEVDYSAHTDEKGIVQNHGCDGGIAGEVKYLADNLLPNLLKKHEPGSVLIAFRTKAEGGPLEVALANAGHQYVKVGSTAAYPKAPLTRFVEEVALWCASGWETGDPKLRRVVHQWIALQKLVEPEVVRAERLRLVRFMFDHRDGNAQAADWLAALEREVFIPGDARTRLLAGGDVECFDDLGEAVRPGGTLESFTVRNLGGQAGSREHLNLMTLHASKGSEFPVVILVGADEGSFPFANVVKGSVQEDEARRLFYVAVSRAQRELHILWSKTVPGDRTAQGPSRFLREMAKKLKAADHASSR